MATDAFTGSDGTSPPSANWTNDSASNGMQIQSNRAVGTVGPAVNAAIYTGASFSADQYSEATLYHGGVSRSILLVRATSGGDFYFADFNVDTATTRISKRVSGSYSDLPANLGAPTSGHVYRLEVIGTSIKVYDNGVQMGITQTDSDIASGQPGIGSISPTEGWDDWTGTDLSGGGGSVKAGAIYHAMLQGAQP